MNVENFVETTFGKEWLEKFNSFSTEHFPGSENIYLRLHVMDDNDEIVETSEKYLLKGVDAAKEMQEALSEWFDRKE